MKRQLQISAAVLALGFGLATGAYAADPAAKGGQGDQQKEQKNLHTGSDLSGDRDTHLGPATDESGSTRARRSDTGRKGELSEKMTHEEKSGHDEPMSKSGKSEQRKGPSTSRDSGTGAGQ